MKVTLKLIAFACGLLSAGAFFDGVFGSRIVVEKAAVIVDSPAISGSPAYAQVPRRAARRTARRTSRRVIRRSSIYAATLPAGCRTVVVEGASLYQCGTTYYQPYGNQYVVVYIN